MLGLKGIAASLAIGVIGMGILYVMLSAAKVEAANAQAALLDTQRGLASEQAQKVELQHTLEARDRDLETERARAVLGDNTAAQLTADNQRLSRRLAIEVRNVALQDDGPAAPVLEYAANGLRDYAKDIAALRTRDAPQASVPGAEDSIRSIGNLPASRGSWPTGQRDFAAVALEFGEYALACSTKLAGVLNYQIGYNVLVQQRNAEASP